MASPITPALKSSARSAYRALFRASGTTFAGDDRVLYAFREKVRTETVAGRQEVDPAEYEARVKHAFEVAEVLKKNVVQGVKEGEGQDSAWRLRMTSDTELGSNEAVKAPYSRPARGTPRTKCGEDPNAVSPLPPRSLRHMVGSNSTRSYSTASSSSPSNSIPHKKEQEVESEEKYDRVRVQSLRNRLLEVNRRVSASPTGREPTTERTLVEDKLGALAARMEFLAAEMHDKLDPPSSNSASAQSLVDLLLDQLPISPELSAHVVGPPAQFKQYIRFLQSAAKHTNTVRAEAISHTPEVRKAIAELVETPAPGTRRPDNALEKLRAIQWRMLMIKRGIQGVVRSRTASHSELTPMFNALREAMRDIGYAQECIQDLEDNGPRVEDARTLVEEMEKSERGSCIMELRKEMERRLAAGVAGKRMEDTIVSYGLSPRTVTRGAYRRIRQYEDFFPSVMEVVTKAQQEDNLNYAKKWRRKLFTRTQKLLNAIRRHLDNFNTVLDQLIALHPRNDEKAVLLREARQEMDFPTNISDEQFTLIAGKAKYGSWYEWADIIADRLALVEELVDRTVTADRCLEQYAWGESGGLEVDLEKKSLFFDAKLSLVIVYDVAWRLERRMKYDVEGLREAAVLLCEEVQRKQPSSETASSTPIEITLRTAITKITKFQERLLEIQTNINSQIIALDGVARLLNVHNDRLHPLVHCKHILQLDTSSALHGLLRAIADKTPEGQQHTTQEYNNAIWLESRILAVQLWVVKRLLTRIQLLEIENKALHVQVQNSLEDVATQIHDMSMIVAALRDIFHRVRPERGEESPQEDWAKNFLVKGDKNADLDDPVLAPTTESSQLAFPQKSDTGELVPHSVLLENLAIVAAYSRQESAIWKIERFLSRIEDVHYRVARAINRLDQLAQDLQVAEDRTHPIISCKHILQLNSFGSLDMVLRILRKRTPKNQIELQQGMGEALWLDSRLPEVQLEVVKMRLWAFHSTMKGQAFSHQQKKLIRSIRGRIKVAHGLLRDSRGEFSSSGPREKLEFSGDISSEERRGQEEIANVEKA
ncbi:unnamed protein product [Rhizoctonia solani]|uniref:Mitochondrial zinc maintenance protein 1, mitochondrial n=1 Tax=Rhizoctonia solani TaxID=456999 RepID=A0A8H2XR22_9AGAM|nr:unnamed protein product [Rhizoctonia solani]